MDLRVSDTGGPIRPEQQGIMQKMKSLAAEWGGRQVKLMKEKGGKWEEVVTLGEKVLKKDATFFTPTSTMSQFQVRGALHTAMKQGNFKDLDSVLREKREKLTPAEEKQFKDLHQAVLDFHLKKGDDKIRAKAIGNVLKKYAGTFGAELKLTFKTPRDVALALQAEFWRLKKAES